LGINFDADLLAMLDLNGFAVTAISGANTINGIFDQDYFEIIDSNSVVESSQPAFTCRTSDVSSISHGDTLTINSINYKVVGNKPDGTGMSVLPLEAP